MGAKQLLYFGGIIPTVFGGGTLGWWFGQDKTIGDALLRIGQVPFENAEDFKTVYGRFKDSEGFKESIPNATSWESVSKWCKERLSFELNDRNIKEVLPKVLRYCTEFKEVEIEKNKKLPHFGGLMTVISDNTKEISGKQRTSIFTFVHNGTYYCAYDVESPNDKTKFEKCTAPGNYYTLYLEKYGLISQNDNTKWDRMLQQYLKAGNPLNLSLKDYVLQRDMDGQDMRLYNQNNKQNRDALATYCHRELLRKTYTNEDDYEKDLKTAVTWCTETGLDKSKLDRFQKGERQ